MASVFADRQVLVFVSIIAAALMLVLSVLVLNVINPLLFVLLMLLAAGLVLAFPRVAEFREYERGVLFRTGRLKGVIGPGWALVFPLFEKYVVVDLRTQVVNIKPESVISLDGVAITVDAAVNYKVTDPAKYVLSAKNVDQLMNIRVTSALREAVSKRKYLDVISNTGDLNDAIRASVDADSAGWGIVISLAEVERVVLPSDLLDAMKLKEEAEQKKDAVEVQASIKKVYLERLDEAASKLSPTTMSYLYLDALRKMAFSKSGKIIIPYEFSKLGSLLKSIYPDAGN